MARREIRNYLDRVNRYNHNMNYIELYQKLDNIVGEITEEVFNKIIDGSKFDWINMVDTLDDLPSNPEEGTAVGVIENNTIYRYDGSDWISIQKINLNPISEVDERLTQQALAADDSAFYGGLGLRRNVKPILSFVDDDSHRDVWDQLKPVVDQEKVPINLAVITGQIGNSSRLTLNQLKALQKLGFETSSHTHNHVNLRDLTESEQEEEMFLSKEWLRNHGFEADALVYPYGGRNAEVMRVAERYYRAGIYIDSGQKLNDTPIRAYDLQRVYLNGVGEMRVQRVKDKIDEAIATNSWMIVGMHCHYAGFDKDGLIEVIQYAKSRGVEIVTIKEGLERFNNIIDLPDLQIDAKGRMTRNRYTRYSWLSDTNDFTNDTLIYDYPRGTTVRFLNASENAEAGFANGGQGVLYTHRSGDNRESYQTFVYSITGLSYYRPVIGAGGSWGPWVRQSVALSTHNRSIDFGTVPAQSTKKITLNSRESYSSDGKMSWRLITSLPDGIIANFATSGSHTGEFILCNVTNSDIDCGEQTFRITNFREGEI